MKRSAEGSLECSLWDRLGGLVRKRLQNGAGAVRTVFEKDRQGAFHGGEAVIVHAGVAVDAIEKRGQIEEFVACFDELEIEEILLARHGGKFGAGRAAVNGEEADDGLRGAGGWCELRRCSRRMCMI